MTDTTTLPEPVGFVDADGEYHGAWLPGGGVYSGAQMIAALSRIEALERERDVAIGLLAAWCVDVEQNGTGWDDWDENYKDAMYRPGPLRELLDAAIAEVRQQRKSWKDRT